MEARANSPTLHVLLSFQLKLFAEYGVLHRPKVHRTNDIAWEVNKDPKTSHTFGEMVQLPWVIPTFCRNTLQKPSEEHDQVWS